MIKFDGKKTGIFAAGVAFGTAGIKILSSKDAKRAYTQCTAAALRAKDCVMKTVNTVQENAEDILAEAKSINEEREAKAEAAKVSDASEDVCACAKADEQEAEQAEATAETAEAEKIRGGHMKFTIKHESRGRMRVHMEQYRMTYELADTLLYVILNHRNVTFVKAYDRTADAVIEYVGDREQIIELLRHFHYESANVPQTVIKTSGRELNNSFQEKLIGSVVWHYSKKLLLPWPIRTALTVGRSIKYIGIGLKCLLQRKIVEPELDATAISVSLVSMYFSSGSSIMFLLGIGELLEEWTHKKSVDDLARSMSLNVSKVWLRTPENQEILVESSKIEKGDKVVVHTGNVIPFDGEVLDGDAMVNQASLTGESVPVQRTVVNTVFAGTVVEDGEITIRVKEVEGNNRFDQIVTMIEESEKLKSELEGKAEHYADKLVPWTLGATGLTYLLTRNVTKAMSILMVDFCCALKLAMPISVLSAIRVASLYYVSVNVV